jgi:hypothetical protein
VKREVTILDAIADKKLFARLFKDRATWRAWLAFLAALFALPMTAVEVEVYRGCTGRTISPTEPAKRRG